MLPIIIQQGITNFVGLLDNIMVGQVGTEQMSGVAIANQLQFIFQLCIFGSLSGAGIFCAQYFGKGDQDKIRSVFRYKVLSTALITFLGIGVFWFFRTPLIRLFLTESGSGNLEATLQYGTEYMVVMLIGMIPFAAVQLYASTMRETGETSIPMRAGIIAVLVNMVGNYILIFGHFGAPKLGVTGAAVATAISRFAELGIILIYTRVHRARFPYFTGIYRTLTVPLSLAKDITVKGMPLLLNELMWSLGTTIIVQCYSTRGLSAVAAYNISSTVSNFFAIAVFAMGSAISILVGQDLGAGEFERARDTNRKMIAFGMALCLFAAVLLAMAAPFFPKIYNTTEEVRSLANRLLWLDALFLTARGLYNSCYFTLRSGGKTLLTFLFDSVSMWVVNIPLALILAYCTGIALIPMFLIVQCADALKAVAGLILVKKGIWINNLTV
ncbi:MAG: MATE family efflux transporter [Oscillospiraceae bacterium]|nr:MATE family efflux transporter [Oscillospiraceae bacterium]